MKSKTGLGELEALIAELMKNSEILNQFDKGQESSENMSGRIPTFLGIDIESDPKFDIKLKSLFFNMSNQAGKPKVRITKFNKIVRTRSPTKTWNMPDSYHVRSLFIGGNEQKWRQSQFKFHQEVNMIPIQIRAVIYIPNKLMIGICFPQCNIENQFPHLTLKVSQGWSPGLSNSVIEATCKQNKVFEQAYLAANNSLIPARNTGIHTAMNV